MSVVTQKTSDAGGMTTAQLTARGVTSKQDITVAVAREAPGHGIVFELKSAADGSPVRLPALATAVVNTLRNVVIGQGQTRLCIVEHFLAAATLWGLDDLLVKVDGPEMPLGDGSGNLWMDLFAQAGWERKAVVPAYELSSAQMVANGDRSLIAIPDKQFSVTYLMDWNHPAIGRRWSTWSATQTIDDLLTCRTFGMLKEHQMLGLDNDVVSLTEEGFTHELRFDDEPIRHKLLDLVGDLRLCGVNPLAVKARFISIKGGHQMDVELAKLLQSALVRQ